MPYLLAILSAVFYGAADFTGGIVTRRVSAISVVLISQASGLVLVALALSLLPTAAPRAADLWWGAGAGLAGGIGVAFLYYALATGTMSVVAPTTAVAAVGIPVITSIALGERPGWLAVAGIALGIAAIALVSRQTQTLAEAPRLFGPQKGASEDKIDKLEAALTKLADVAAKAFQEDFRDEQGAGAAGGLGFGIVSFCGAKIRPGFDVVAKSIGFESKIKDVDVVITGEGSLDRQTLEGKTPAGVARLARKRGKRVFAIVGRASEDRQVREIFDGVYENAQPGMSEKENMACAAELLRENARELAKSL